MQAASSTLERAVHLSLLRAFVIRTVFTVKKMRDHTMLRCFAPIGTCCTATQSRVLRPKRGDPSNTMIRMTGKDRHRPIKLLGNQNPHKLMRPGEFTET